MVTYALDSSAVLRFLDGEAGSERVAAVIKGHLQGSHRVLISAVHWGEVAGVTCKLHGRHTLDLILSRMLSFGVELVAVTPERAVRAALLKLKHKLSYADAFGAELASDSPDHILLTADFDLKSAARDVKIEFLPRK
jgi:predicted nucleic acid-binding protein